MSRNLVPVLSLTAGTFINVRMVSYLNSNRGRGSVIDRLTLQEQLINLLSGPLILMQLLRILVPMALSDIFQESYNSLVASPGQFQILTNPPF